MTFPVFPDDGFRFLIGKVLDTLLREQMELYPVTRSPAALINEKV